MSDAKGTTVPIKLTVSGESEVVQALKKTAQASREAWLASIPSPQFIDSFEKTATKATQTATAAAKAIQVNYSTLNQESQRAAQFMGQLASAGSKSYASLDKGGVQLQAFSAGVSGLSQELQNIPNLSSVLGLNELGLGVERLRGIANIMSQIRTFLSSAGGLGAAATGGAALSLLPIAYDIKALREISRLKGDTMQGREENNLRVLGDLNKLVSERRISGQLRGPAAEDIAGQITGLIGDQTKAKQSSDIVRGAVGQNVQSEIAALFAKIRDITRESYGTEQEGARAHAEALEAINKTRLDGEASTLKTTLEAKLRDTNASEADQLDAARTFVDRMRGIAVEAAASQKELLDLREGQLKGDIARNGNDPEALAKIQNGLAAIADARLQIEQETDSKLESLEADHIARVEKVRLDYAKKQADEAERFAKEQEKAAADAERAARQAQRDADRLLQTRQQELQARMAAVGSDFRLTNAQKYGAESQLIRDGFDNGVLSGTDANAYQSRLGANPNDLRQQMQAAMVDIQNMFGTVAQQVASGFRNVIGTAVNSISDGITGLIMRTQTWGQALRNIGTSILTSIVHTIVQMGVQWAIGFAIQKTLGKIAVKSAISDAATLAAAWGPPAVLAAIATEGSAAGVGLASTIAAMAIGTGAATAMSGSGMGFADGGYTGDGPRHEVAGYVHRGEYVLDAMTVDRIGLPALQALQVEGSPAAAPVQSGPSGSVINIAMMDTPSKIRHFFESEDGENLYVDMARRTSHRWSRA